MGAACDTLTNEKVLLIVEICHDCLNDYWHDCTCVHPLALCEVVYGKDKSIQKSIDFPEAMTLDNTYSKQEQVIRAPILGQILTKPKMKRHMIWLKI